ncbi:hypothetical protein KEM52_005835 [Ascosphaera acerosa]|nr:hypothetical protein KEM52_005835 [Ascosphaera acerosa]
MGASESKLVFRQGIFRLAEPAVIPADDPYWAQHDTTLSPSVDGIPFARQFWELPESVEDVFSLFGAADVRRTRDGNLANLETLLLAVCSKLVALRHHPSFPDYTYAPARDALNCVRILTRILPFIYEADNLERWEEQFFWAKRRKKTREAQLRAQVLFDEAETGAGTGGEDEPDRTQTRRPSREEDYHEVKPLAEELIDTLIDLLFFSGFTIPQVNGNGRTQHGNGNGNGKVSYSIWSSGVGCNSAMGSNRELESNRTEVLRLLLTLASKSMYMSSEDSTSLAARNYYRHYFGRLHRPEDFQFIVEGMTKILNQPVRPLVPMSLSLTGHRPLTSSLQLASTTSYLPGSQKPAKWAPEMIMLFWEALQCNRAFQTFIIESNRVHDFVVLCIYHATEYRSDPSMHGVSKMCIFVLQTLSVEPGFGKSIHRQLKAGSTLPPNQMHSLFPSLLAILNNMGAHIKNLSLPACRRIHLLLAQMSSPRFLIANESNHLLLQSLLQFINSILEHQFTENPGFVYVLLRSRKHYENLREFTIHHASELDQMLWEQQNRSGRRKSNLSSADGQSPRGSHQSERRRDSNSSAHLNHVPEDSAFAVGDDDDDDDHDGDELDDDAARPETGSTMAAHKTQQRQSSVISTSTSRPPSIISTTESVPQQLRGMSEKARGKMPVGQFNFSRQNSSASLGGGGGVYGQQHPAHGGATAATTYAAVGFIPTSQWIDSWITDLPLHTPLAVISALMPHMPTPDLPGPSDPEAAPIIASLPSFVDDPIIRSLIAERSPPRIHSFQWSPLSLGWYESLLWGSIFTSEMVVGNTASGATPGAVGVWNGTAIRLFRVQEAAVQGPSLRAPRGAVDAVGNNLVQRINSLGFGSRNSSSTNIHASAGNAAAASQGQGQSQSRTAS